MPELVWSVPRRVAFRFGFIAGALFLISFPALLLPKMDWFFEIVQKPWDYLVPWFAEHVLGVDASKKNLDTGSGDTMWMWVFTLLLIVIGAIGAGVWSILDRKRLAYPRLQALAIVALRYFLASMMFGYGVAKMVDHGQFAPPTLGRLDQSIGESSPMGMLWTFMGSSQPYSAFAGALEVLGGVLLLWRRTTVLGAIVVAAVMSNVVVLNLCYDVPVKLFSMQLLFAALLILLPHIQRLLRAMLGYAVEEVPPRTRSAPRIERARLVGKIFALAFLAYSAWKAADRTVMRKTEVQGAWVVETFEVDGVQRAPLLTDEVRWRKFIATERGLQVRKMTDKRDRYYPYTVDPAQRTIKAKPYNEPAKPELVLNYVRPDRTHLVLDGVVDGKRVRATLVLEPEPLLTTRGFHWVQEFPFNR